MPKPRKNATQHTSSRLHKRTAPPANPEAHARKIAEAVEAAWHSAHGTGRLDVPVSAVATIAALPQKDSQGNDVVASMGAWNTDGFIEYARHTWRSIIRARPETTHLLYPLIAWLFDNAETAVHPHAQAVAQAALRTSQPDLTGTDRRFETDLLGNVLMGLRSKSALQARGQFYTPGDVAKLIARMSDLEGRSTILEPMMGTGGMLRAAAEVLRERGHDPRSVQWVGCDLDELAVACATVNSMIWGLGTDIVFHAGNALTPNWQSRALAQREELRQLATGIKRDLGSIVLLRSI
ncbi:SAM-dependent methyltransferase [Saccharothrix sp. AJ9571]|nr:SAM-dependent methyltransferase [Saccharothrix sp. AJ9571]